MIISTVFGRLRYTQRVRDREEVRVYASAFANPSSQHTSTFDPRVRKGEVYACSADVPQCKQFIIQISQEIKRNFVFLVT